MKKHSSYFREKIKTRVLCAITVVAMAGACFIPANVTSAKKNYGDLSDISSDSIKEKEEEIRKLQEQKDQIKGQISDIEDIKAELETEKDNLTAYITEIDSKIEEVNYNIMDMQDQILLKQADIEEAQQQLADAKADEKTQYDAMIVRLKLMYETGDESILSSLLGATSLQDLLNRMDYIEAVASYDRAAWQALKKTAEYVDLCEQQLELEESMMEDTESSLEEEQANLNTLEEEKTAELEEYIADIAAKQDAIDGYNDAIDDADDEIALLEAAIQAEREAIYDELHKYDGGKFVFPIASYTYISSKYGWRIHPVYGTKKFHSGVDLAAPYGTAIYAAYEGVVAQAGYSSSMGNYVMINHGDGLFTIYMHCSKLYVSAKDEVETGQTIAAVGSTGTSTGNHLHFSVRLNGEYVDPNDYVYFYDRD